MANPSLTKPKLLAHWADDVDAIYRNFQLVFASDTGPWISDSGTTILAAECIRLKGVGANFSDQLNDGRLARAESRLRRMGQGAVAAVDTGSQTL